MILRETETYARFMEALMRVALFIVLLALIIAVIVFAFLHPGRGIGEETGYQVPLVIAPLWVIAALFGLSNKDRRPP